MKKDVRQHLVSCAFAIPLILAAACGGGGEPAPTTAPAGAAPAAPAAVVDEATAATVTGKVNFSGTAPEPQKINMEAEPTCAEKHPEGAFAENVVVNSNNTLKNVMVYVKTGLEGKSFPASQQPAVLDQTGCQYVPHVLGAQVGQPVIIRNSDGILHNIHPSPKVNKEFNVGQPRNMDTTKTFDKAELGIPVGCEVHGWMNAYINVLDHPFFAVTGDDGTFTLKGLPPGDYTLEAWHEEYAPQTMQVTVGAQETKQADFTFTGS